MQALKGQHIFGGEKGLFINYYELKEERKLERQRFEDKTVFAQSKVKEI